MKSLLNDIDDYPKWKKSCFINLIITLLSIYSASASLPILGRAGWVQLPARGTTYGRAGYNSDISCISSDWQHGYTNTDNHYKKKADSLESCQPEDKV
jgi:hypothetical protein